MAFPDDQADLLKTAITALHSWQATAGNVDVVLQSVTMNFPAPDGVVHEVRFTWDAQAERFDISS